MSGIAELLANLGFEVSGSDARRSDTTRRLEETFGVRVHEGHEAAHVGDAEVVVFSSAVRPSNPEIVEASRRGIPVIPRAEMLAELMRLRFSIAVAGSHGKTTTTSMIAVVLERAGLDPTAVIGGRLSAFGSNARLGRSEYLVAEADESDRSFLMLSPTIAVLTNIDHEHMESYGSFADLQQAFVEFANKVPFYGSVIACADEAELAAVLPRVNRRVVTYGLNDGAAVRLAALSRRRRTRMPAPTYAASTWSSARSAGAAWSIAATARTASGLACCSCCSPAGTTCRTRWRRWPSRIVSGSSSAAWRRRSPIFAAPSGASSGTARRAACSWSTTTAITRPRSPRCSTRRAPRSGAASWWRFSRTATRARSG